MKYYKKYYKKYYDDTKKYNHNIQNVQNVKKQMVYSITNYTRSRAKKIGVQVKPSTNKTKKIDVYRHDKKIASVGAAGMNDYPTYMKKRGNVFAKTRRRLYKIRHNKDRKERWTNGWLADQLLW